VAQLLTWLWDKQYQLPRPRPPAMAWRLRWWTRTYTALLDLLQNPVYAGLYAYPRFPYGDNRVAGWYSAQEDASHAAGRMEVRREGNHPAYIDVAQYEAIRKRSP